MRYIKSYPNSGAVQTALNEEELGKPYMAYLEDEHRIDWNSLEPISLPNKPFLFNYTAKRYDSSTGTFIKEEGQLYNKNVVLQNIGNVVSYDNYVRFNSDAFYAEAYYRTSQNQFNRTSADCAFTFIYKTGRFRNNGNEKLFSNRRVGGQEYQSKNDCHNYLIASKDVFGFDGSFSPSSNPQYVVIRAFADNSGLRQEVDVNGNVIKSSYTPSVGWDAPSAGIGFFTGGVNYSSSAENFKGDFYWMYCANETLTDAEVLKVIKYNEKL